MRPFLRSRRLAAFAALAASCLIHPSAHADAPAAAELGLSDVVRRMLEHNLDLQIRDLQPLLAQDALMRARASFDPRAFAEVTYENVQRQQNTIEFISTGGLVPQQGRYEEENVRTRVGLGGRLFTGATYELSATAAELDNSINRTSPLAPFRPEYQSLLGFELTQPLLQNRGSAAALAEIRIATLELGVSELERELELTNKLIEVVNAYYDLVFGQENLRVKLEAEQSAARLLGDNRRRLEVGRASPLDVSQAEVRVSEAREEVLLARDFLRDRRVALLRLISPDFTAARLPELTVRADFVPVAPPAAAELLAHARQHRPDVRLAADESAIAALRHRRARNGALPQLDLNFTYGLNGLESSWGDTLYRATRANEPQWSGGLVLSLPLGNRAARAEARSARRLEEQAELRRRQVDLNLALDIHHALDRLALQQERLATAGTSREAAEQGLRAELQRLEAGQTTAFNVLQMQDRASAARTRELAARVDLQKTQAEIWAVGGMLFERLGFTFQRRGDPAAANDRWSPWTTLRRE